MSAEEFAGARGWTVSEPFQLSCLCGEHPLGGKLTVARLDYFQARTENGRWIPHAVVLHSPWGLAAIHRYFGRRLEIERVLPGWHEHFNAFCAARFPRRRSMPSRRP